MRHQPVITGLGIVSPIGIGIEKFWEAALAGRSGIGRPTLFDGSKLPPECRIVGEVYDFNPLDWMPAREVKTAARFSQFAVAAAKMARNDSRLDTAGLPPERVKVAIGTSLNGHIDVAQPNYESFLRGGQVSPWAALEFPAHAATAHVAIHAGATGQTTTFATACAAGLDALGWAANQITNGHATAVLAGASETPLSAFMLRVFHSVGVLSKWQGPPEEASRPFEMWRSGLVLAEGAAVMAVESEESARARKAPLYAKILGAASANEGAHLRKVDETGDSVARAIEAALRDADLAPRDIDLICAHGNSMQDYDAAETAGIKRVFGSHAWNMPVSSPKSMCGQALAASSAMQVVVGCLALQNQAVPPTINYEMPDPQCDLDYVPNTYRRARVRTVLVHSHSLGGAHLAMILGAPD
jgi:3-oxoacyl-[acyl-carrier-protein] synthase II